MIDPSQIRFPNIDKAFLRGLFWLLVFLLLASVFSVAQGIYDVLIQRPEVREVTLKVGKDANFGTGIWIQRAIIIHNRGNADAENVRIQCLVPNGKITRIAALSEEYYTVDKVAEGTDSCSFSIDRLASESKFVLLVWATISSANFSESRSIDIPFVSATFDGGTAKSSDKPTAFEEVQALGSRLARGIAVIAHRLGHKIEASIVLENLVNNTLPYWGFYFYGVTQTGDGRFSDALIAVLMLAVAAWLLLPRVWTGLIMGLLFSLLVWLYTEFLVETVWLILPFILGLYALWTTKSAKTVRGRGEAAILITFLLLLVWGGIATFSGSDVGCLSSGTTIEAILNCTQSDVHGGIWIGSMVFVLYLLFFDL